MNIKSKKGFTLVELLAVTIILIVIIFLAFTKIKGSSQKSKKNSIKASAISYVKAVNGITSVDGLTNPRFKEGFFTHETFKREGLKLSGEEPDKAFFILDNFEASYACIQYGAYYVVYENESYSDAKRGNCSNESRISNIIGNLNVEFDYTGNYQEFTVPVTGEYKIELWGAAGGAGGAKPAGSYTSGNIALESGEVLYVFVGEKGENTKNYTAYNGGGTSTQYYSDNNNGSGGGATDVRLVGGTWNDAVGLRSRIMVAAGGAGLVSDYSGNPSGGTLSSPNVTGVYGAVSTGATQTSGASFGIGGTGVRSGGGGGYWGGGANTYSGAGGSSYISGHVGCVALQDDSANTPKTGCSNGTNDVECSIHYSGKYFTDTIMLSGSSDMPGYDTSDTITGNSGNGHARITYIK